MPVPGGEITNSSIWTGDASVQEAADVNLATRCVCGGALDYTGEYDPTVLYKRIHHDGCPVTDTEVVEDSTIEEATTESD